MTRTDASSTEVGPLDGPTVILQHGWPYDMRSSEAITRSVSTIEPRTSSFGKLKQIDAGVLSIGYVDLGPVDGPAVVLLHGWPYDIHSYVDVAPLLAARG